MANSSTMFGAGVLPDPPAGRAPFPHTREEFTEDERVSFSKEINRFILEAEDGTEWEFNEPLGRWQEAVSVHFVSYLYNKATCDHRIKV
jgi:hypothetical protein